MDKKNVLIIIILIFLFIYWFQESEKYNKNKNKNKVYKIIDNVKLPFLVSSFVYLAFCLNGKEINLSGGGAVDISSDSNDYLEIFTNQPEF
tara:strand:+ start:68 stop:340 length:273 start_codon:yes stop_codon:yes gene_type:complete